MPKVVTITGCTSPVSRAGAVLAHVHKTLAAAAITPENIAIRQLPATDLSLGRIYSTPVRQSKSLIEEADGVVIAASVCKTTYNGGLKAFLDLLSADAFRGKIILPIVLSASALDFPAVDYSLQAVLAGLGANAVLDALFLLERQVQLHDRQVHFDELAQPRLQSATQNLIRSVRQKASLALFGYVPPLVAIGAN
ncbi:MAG: NAD(P)H-dependent oxidoreductase [Caldilineaceae bacterium]|nr:NAD(P)H-dependent oxidoreductase [Caldilineaceae bacterium]